MLQREKEAEHFKTWEEQEDNFHLQQAKLRYAPADTLLPPPPSALMGPNTGAPCAPGPLYMLFPVPGAFRSGWSPFPFRSPPITSSESPSLEPVSPVESRAKETSERSLPCVVLLHQRQVLDPELVWFSLSAPSPRSVCSSGPITHRLRSA